MLTRHEILKRLDAIPENRQSRIQKAFKQVLEPLWNCRVSARHLRSEFEIIHRGVASVEHPFYKVDALQEVISNSLCVAGIVELAAEGANITICKEQSAVKVYLIINEYISAWVSEGINSLDDATSIYRQDLVSDLLQFENYAATLHKKINHLLPNQPGFGMKIVPELQTLFGENSLQAQPAGRIDRMQQLVDVAMYLHQKQM